MKKTSKLLLTSVLTIAMCISLIAGATFALFTSNDSVNIAVSSGKVEVKASIGDILTYSYVEQLDGSYAQETVGRTDGSFEVGGEAHKTDTGIVINNIVPGDKVEFNIIIENSSNVAVKYQTFVSLGKITVDGKEMESHEGLLNALKIKVEDEELVASGLSGAKYSNWDTLPAGTTPIAVVVELPYDYDDNSNDADSIQGKMCAIDFTVQAVQGNAQTYDPTEANPEFTGPAINNASDLMAFSKMVNSGDYTLDQAYLTADIDLGGVDSWEPIGTLDHPFTGTFDGKGHTVSGLNATSLDQLTVAKISVLGNSYTYGLFGTVGDLLKGTEGNVTLKNLKVTGEISITSGEPGEIPLCLAGLCVNNNASSAVIENVWSDVDIRVENVKGAVIAAGQLSFCNGNVDFQDCLNTGDIILPIETIEEDGFAVSTSIAGGIVTILGSGSHLTNCVNVGKVIGTEYLGLSYCGGIAFTVNGSGLKVVKNCYSIDCKCFEAVGDDYEWAEAHTLVSGSLTAADFEGLDFDNIWDFNTDLGYPVLKLK